MSAKSIVLVAIGVVSMYCATIWAHTESEYLNMARNMIGTLQSLDWECEEELLERQESDDPLYHWDYTSQDDFFGFFGYYRPILCMYCVFIFGITNIEYDIIY